MERDASVVATELFSSGFYCAESVLAAVAQHAGFADPLVPRIATGLCSGVARTCGPCGAYSGAVLAIGAVLGRDSPQDSIEVTYDAVQHLHRAFVGDFGSVNCGVLLGCDLNTEEGQRAYAEARLEERCRAFVGAATAMALEAIARWREAHRAAGCGCGVGRGEGER